MHLKCRLSPILPFVYQLGATVSFLQPGYNQSTHLGLVVALQGAHNLNQFAWKFTNEHHQIWASKCHYFTAAILAVGRKTDFYDLLLRKLREDDAVVSDHLVIYFAPQQMPLNCGFFFSMNRLNNFVHLRCRNPLKHHLSSEYKNSCDVRRPGLHFQPPHSRNVAAEVQVLSPSRSSLWCTRHTTFWINESKAKTDDSNRKQTAGWAGVGGNRVINLATTNGDRPSAAWRKTVFTRGAKSRKSNSVRGKKKNPCKLENLDLERGSMFIVGDAFNESPDYTTEQHGFYTHWYMVVVGDHASLASRAGWSAI